MSAEESSNLTVESIALPEDLQGYMTKIRTGFGELTKNGQPSSDGQARSRKVHLHRGEEKVEGVLWEHSKDGGAPEYTVTVGDEVYLSTRMLGQLAAFGSEASQAARMDIGARYADAARQLVARAFTVDEFFETISVPETD